MNPFKRYGIDHLSPSALNAFAAQPCWWVMKYCLGMRSEGPAMWRGKAVEAGVDHFVYGERDEEKMMVAMINCFCDEAQGEVSDEIDKEYKSLPNYLKQALLGLEERQITLPPIGRQLKVEHWFDGLEVPVIGYVDYEWDDFGIDLKTTKQIRKDISGGHARQVSLYSTCRGKPYKLLYVSEKKHEMRELSRDEVKHHLGVLEWYAQNVRRALSLGKDPEDLVRLFPPDFDHFYWRDKDIKDKAMEILDVKKSSAADS